MVKLDDLDRRILKILVENARTPYTSIAREIGYSDVAIIKRIKKLEKEGVIKKYTVIVDHVKLGYNKVSFTGINVEPDALLRVIDILKNKDYVKFLAVTSGDHQLIAVIWARDNEELIKIHKEIESIPGVSKAYPAILLDIVKEYSL